MFFLFFYCLPSLSSETNLQKSSHISQRQFHLLTSMDLHHRWMWLFVSHPGNHGSCCTWPWTQESHHLSPCLSSQQCFCQNSYAGRATLWCAQQVSAFCPNPAQRYKTFSCVFLIVSYYPRQERQEVEQIKYPHQKEGSFKTQFQICLREEIL